MEAVCRSNHFRPIEVARKQKQMDTDMGQRCGRAQEKKHVGTVLGMAAAAMGDDDIGCE